MEAANRRRGMAMSNQVFFRTLATGLLVFAAPLQAQVSSEGLRTAGSPILETPASQTGPLVVPLNGNAARSGSLTVAEIMALNEAQVGDDAIVAKIKATGARFDLSTDEMIALRKRGLSGQVLAAMVSTASANGAADVSPDSPDPAVAHAPGVYALIARDTGQKMARIDPTASSQMKTGGILGYALTGGIASMSMKVSIPGPAARVRVGSAPVFYFFFDESRAGANTSSFMGSAFLASSPNEFNLVRLERKSDRRETKVGKVNLGGMKAGVMDKDRVPFSYDLVRPGVYKVTIDAALAAGEYGFLYSLPGAGTSGAASARIFDFSVY
jgi:hypothetical protein